MGKIKKRNKKFKTGITMFIVGILSIFLSFYMFYNLSPNTWLNSMSGDFGYLGFTLIILGGSLAFFNKDVESYLQ